MPSLADQNPAMRGNLLKKLKDIGIAHADTAMGFGLRHRLAIRCAVDVDIPLEGVTCSQPVASRLKARQPEDAGEYPVATGKLLMQLWRPDLTSPAPAAQDRTERKPSTDLCTYLVPTPRGATRTRSLPRTVSGRGNGIGMQQLLAAIDVQALLSEADQEKVGDLHGALA